MNAREKRLATIVGAAVGAYVLYMGYDSFFAGSIRKAKSQRESYVKKYNDLTRLRREKEQLEKTWREAAGRTFSFDETVAKDMLDRELKQIAARMGFDRPSVKNAAPMRIGVNSPIKARATAVTVSGPYVKAMAFLWEIYRAPFLCQVTHVTMAPLGPRFGRDEVKLDIVVETPVLPQRFKGVEFSEAIATMPPDAVETLPPFRQDIAPPEYFAVFENRNILREYMPAPVTSVMIDNQDRKMVGVKATFFWDGKEETQLTKGVEGKKQVQLEGKGDIVELTIAYADGKTIGPVRHEFANAGSWAYRVESHTPEPPPEIVNLAVDNKNAEDVLVNIVITTPDNKQITPPTMLIDANKTIDLGEWEARQIAVTARYKSNKPAPSGTYQPSPGKQTIVIPPEPEEIVRDVTAPPAIDPPADASYTVSGLWTYRDVQEMIVTGSQGRKVVTVGEAGAVDGGTLLAVHPLGGVIVMPATGNYYLYPLGKSFDKRVLLKDAHDESQLAEAIDMWARQ